MNIEEQLKQILKIPVIEERYLELIKLLNKDRDRLMKQNQRYKQALELIYKDTFYESEHDLVSPIHVIRKRAEKALEGEI